MNYDLQNLPLDRLLPHVINATQALARLDERVSCTDYSKNSGIMLRQGFISRLHFYDALHALWCTGERIDLEDLVLHDAHMDNKVPSVALSYAHSILTMRRKLWTHPPEWAMGVTGLQTLIDVRRVETDHISQPKMALMDVMQKTADLPVVLQAVLVCDAVQRLSICPRRPFVAGLVASALLRQKFLVSTHLLSIHSGLKDIRFECKHAKDPIIRLMALLDALHKSAQFGLKEFDRLIIAHDLLSVKLKNKRGHSKLPDLINLVMEYPQLTSAFVADHLGVSVQSALHLIHELELREYTGRKRYRSWGIL
jgi:hypothetical protein